MEESLIGAPKHKLYDLCVQAGKEFNWKLLRSDSYEGFLVFETPPANENEKPQNLIVKIFPSNTSNSCRISVETPMSIRKLLKFKFINPQEQVFLTYLHGAIRPNPEEKK